MITNRVIAEFIGGLLLSGSLTLLLCQTPSAGIEQQLRSQYRIASVGGNGVVVRPGTVVVVQKDGITALPSPGDWPCNSYKQGTRIKQSTMCAVNYSISKDQTRPLQVGEKAYLTAIQVKPTEVVFKLQTCCGDANDAPFRAGISFQFGKGYMDSMNVQQIRDAIGEVFAIDTSITTEEAAPSPSAAHRRKPAGEPAGAEPPQPSPTYIAPLKLPSTYVNAQGQTDRLQLNADQSFSLQEAGQSYHGTFVDNGNTLELSISETNTKTTATKQGSNLTDSSGQTWVLREQPAATAPAGATLNNDDIVKMAKAGFDDAIIVAKIGSSKCQFDTSTDALIRLKQSGVSGTVIRAMVVGPSTGAK